MLSFECIKNEKSVYFLLTSAYPARTGKHNGSNWAAEGFSLSYRDKLDQYRDNESLWKQFRFSYNLITAREHRLGTLKTEYSFIRYITVCQSRTGSTP